MNHGEKQVVLGTILGGSSIVKAKNGKNCYLAMRSRKESLIQYKVEELKTYNNCEIIKENNTYRWRSICSKDFNEFYELSKKRKIEEKFLDKLCDVGMAVWFMDKGTIEENITLNTRIFGKAGTSLIKNYFNDILEIECSIKNNLIVFDKEGSEKLLSIIAHLMR